VLNEGTSSIGYPEPNSKDDTVDDYKSEQQCGPALNACRSEGEATTDSTNDSACWAK
jgi:hypothetical protein